MLMVFESDRCNMLTIQTSQGKYKKPKISKNSPDKVFSTQVFGTATFIRQIVTKHIVCL